MWQWWFRNGAAGWLVLWMIWAALSVAYDIAIAVFVGTQSTISWQLQQVSVNNPVVPAGIGLLIGGFAIHFFKVRNMAWFNPNQPWLYLVFGCAIGAVLIAWTWQQRG